MLFGDCFDIFHVRLVGHEVEKDVSKSGGGKERFMNQVLKTKYESSSCSIL